MYGVWGHVDLDKLAIWAAGSSVNLEALAHLSDEPSAWRNALTDARESKVDSDPYFGPPRMPSCFMHNEEGNGFALFKR